MIDFFKLKQMLWKSFAPNANNMLHVKLKGRAGMKCPGFNELLVRRVSRQQAGQMGWRKPLSVSSLSGRMVEKIIDFATAAA